MLDGVSLTHYILIGNYVWRRLKFNTYVFNTYMSSAYSPWNRLGLAASKGC